MRNTSSGMSLVELLVSLGILSIIMIGMSSYMVAQQREARSLTEVLAKIDIEKLLLTSLADGSVCTAELSNNALNASAPYTIDTTSATTAAATVINLSGLHASSAVGSPFIIQTGSAPSPMAESLKVNSITLTNFISTGIADQYKADLIIAFNGALIRQLRPIILQSIITTKSTDPINAKKITGCTSGSSDVPVGYGIMPKWDGNWTGNNFTCPTGYTLTFQHYDCHCSNNATWAVCIKN